MNKEAQRKSEKKNLQWAEAWKRYGLNELTPENINKLYSQFLPYIRAAQNPMQQNALGGLLKSQYARGLQGWGGSLSQEAGLRGMMGNNSVQQAFQQAMGLAGQRASVWSGSPPMTQPNYNLGNGIAGAANLGLTAYGIYKNSQQPQSYANYDYSGRQGTVPGTIPPPAWGLPANEEPPLYR